MESETEELISRGKPHFELMLTGDGSRSPPPNPPFHTLHHPQGPCLRCLSRTRKFVENCIPALLLLAVIVLILFMIIAGKVMEE